MSSAVKACDISITLAGRRVLEDISFTAEAGELVGVIGPNGAGKTTLLRALLGLIPLERGKLEVLGTNQASIREIRPQIGYMPQLQSFDKRFPLSAADVVATGLLSPATIFRRIKQKSEKIREALQAVGMSDYADRPFRDMSGGEQQRILLARSLVRKPRLLLLDEPNSGLDFNAQRLFMELLLYLKVKEKLAIILVSHDLVSIAAAADQLLCINRIMHIHGHPSEVMHSADLDLAYRCQFDFLSGSLAEKRCNGE